MLEETTTTATGGVTGGASTGTQVHSWGCLFSFLQTLVVNRTKTPSVRHAYAVALERTFLTNSNMPDMPDTPNMPNATGQHTCTLTTQGKVTMSPCPAHMPYLRLLPSLPSDRCFPLYSQDFPLIASNPQAQITQIRWLTHHLVQAAAP